MSGMVYGRVLYERMMEITGKNVGNEEQGLGKGKCFDRIFALKMVVRKYLEEDETLYPLHESGKSK